VSDPRVAIVTYTTRPRGGPVHAVRLAEELHRIGYPVHLFALGDPRTGFFRPVEVPHTIVPAPEPAPTLEERVFAAADALAEGLRPVASEFDLVHAEDCIAATALLRLRDEGARWLVLRTVHHVDDFTTQALVRCQERSIDDPDVRLVVSGFWQERLRADHGVDSIVVRNGVDLERFSSTDPALARSVRERIGGADRFVFLTVGGIEPRKGSRELFEALAAIRHLRPRPLLAIVGGHSFQDHRAYREEVFDRADELGLAEGDDFALPGTVTDEELPAWYSAADAFAFPSAKEGFGIVVLEALAAGLPVVTSDLPVFREYLVHGTDALMARTGSAEQLALAMARLVREPDLRARLAARGPAVAGRYPWSETAREHARIYREVATSRTAGRGSGAAPAAASS
jgi:glycosyltransferase-like protein